MQYLITILNSNSGTEDPSFLPSHPVDVARANLIVRILDINVSSNQVKRGALTGRIASVSKVDVRHQFA